MAGRCRHRVGGAGCVPGWWRLLFGAWFCDNPDALREVTSAPGRASRLGRRRRRSARRAESTATRAARGARVSSGCGSGVSTPRRQVHVVAAGSAGLITVLAAVWLPGGGGNRLGAVIGVSCRRWVSCALSTRARDDDASGVAADRVRCVGSHPGQRRTARPQLRVGRIRGSGLSGNVAWLEKTVEGAVAVALKPLLGCGHEDDFHRYVRHSAGLSTRELCGRVAMFRPLVAFLMGGHVSHRHPGVFRVGVEMRMNVENHVVSMVKDKNSHTSVVVTPLHVHPGSTRHSVR